MAKQQPYTPQHPAPAEPPDDCCDYGVISQDAEAGEDCKPVMFDVVPSSGADQRQHLRPRVSDVGCRIEPVFEKEEQAENESGSLPLAEEISSEGERHSPLQNGSAPQAKCRTKPSEQKMSAFMHDQVGKIYEQELPIMKQSIDEKRPIECTPRQ